MEPGSYTKPEVESEQKEAAEEETPLFVPSCLKSSDVRFLIQQGIEIPCLETYRAHLSVKTESAAAMQR